VRTNPDSVVRSPARRSLSRSVRRTQLQEQCTGGNGRAPQAQFHPGRLLRNPRRTGWTERRTPRHPADPGGSVRSGLRPGRNHPCAKSSATTLFELPSGMLSEAASAGIHDRQPGRPAVAERPTDGAGELSSLRTGAALSQAAGNAIRVTSGAAPAISLAAMGVYDPSLLGEMVGRANPPAGAAHREWMCKVHIEKCSGRWVGDFSRLSVSASLRRMR
jgi:hypothetical protein